MKKMNFFALSFVLASIGLTLVVVCSTFASQFGGIYISNEEEKLQMYVSLITSDLEALPEGLNEEELSARVDALYSEIEEQSQMRCRLYRYDEDSLRVLYCSDKTDDLSDAEAFYDGRLADGMYCGVGEKYSEGFVICADQFSYQNRSFGVVEMQISTDNLNSINKDIGRTILIAFAVLCVIVIAICLILRFTVYSQKDISVFQAINENGDIHTTDDIDSAPPEEEN